MITSSEIVNLVQEHLAGTEKFLVDVLIKPANRIYVFIDGDHGVTIADCVGLSRFIESKLDREAEDFELNVSSSGAEHPIRLPRQYLKNVGRSLQVKLSGDRELAGKLEGSPEAGAGGRDDRLFRGWDIEEDRRDHPVHRLQAPLPLPFHSPSRAPASGASNRTRRRRRGSPAQASGLGR